MRSHCLLRCSGSDCLMPFKRWLFSQRLMGLNWTGGAASPLLGVDHPQTFLSAFIGLHAWETVVEFSRSPARCVSKGLCEQGSLQVRHVLSVLFHTKDRRLYGDFLGSQRYPKDRLQICWLAFIFIRRGHGELLHTRRFRDFEIRKELVCCPHSSEMGRVLFSK